MRRGWGGRGLGWSGIEAVLFTVAVNQSLICGIGLGCSVRNSAAQCTQLMRHSVASSRVMSKNLCNYLIAVPVLVVA